MNYFKNHRRYLVIVASCLSLSATSLSIADTPKLTADLGYVSIPHLPAGGDKVNPIRFAAIKEASTSLGAQGGLAWEANRLDQALKTESIFLDQTFDFNQLLLPHNVLPPVLAQSDDNLNLANDDTLRIASKTYRIVQPAKFVTAPPNWRDYLWMQFKKPSTPDRSLLPQSKYEAQIWNHYIQVGWQQGISQADAIFTDNLNRLKRDMTGMVLYRQLLAQKMVSAPFVASAQLGVTGDANQLRINDQVLRITAHSQLQPNPTKWMPIITK